MREVLENKTDISKEEARELVERCLKVLYYRDARSYNRVSPSKPKTSFHSIVCVFLHPAYQITVPGSFPWFLIQSLIY